MVFASLTFLYYFLPLLLVFYYASRSLPWRNGVLVFFSLFFYAWGEPVWVTLLIFSAAADYLHGRIIEAHRGRWQSRAAVISSLVVNLGLLAVFKYSSMFLNTVPSFPRFTLPIGISFYTFQTISYTIDVYRDDVPAQRSFWKFLLFVSLFHQLVAGPIVRYREIRTAIEGRRFNPAQFSSGVTRFAVGLAKKVLIANVSGGLAIPFLEGDITRLSVLGAWYGVFLFGIQIYFDFSGYSDMAIGLGRMFGFEYGENFRYPYAARSASEFWRRWHISLGSFFRDYLYIPLGGNRRRVFLNLMLVWFFTGLWHGASWNFVLWGLYYGVLIYIERIVQKTIGPFAARPAWQWLSRVAGHLYLIVITLVGWAIFTFTDLSRLLGYLQAMAGLAGLPLAGARVSASIRNNPVFLVVAVIASLPVVPRALTHLTTRPLPAQIRPCGRFLLPALNVALMVASTIFLVGAGYNPFLYFRF